MQADRAGVAELAQRFQEGQHIERAAAQRLDVVRPAGLVVELVGAIDRDRPEPGHRLGQQRLVVAIFAHAQPVAEVEHHADVRAVHLVRHADGVFDPLQPHIAVRIEQYLRARVAGQGGHLADDLHRPRIAGGVGGFHPVHQQHKLHPAPFEERHDLLELRIVGLLAGRDVHGHGDLKQLEAGGVERLKPLGDVVQPQVADAVVAEFLEHVGLLLQVALLRVVRVDAEGEEGVGLRLDGSPATAGPSRAAPRSRLKPNMFLFILFDNHRSPFSISTPARGLWCGPGPRSRSSRPRRSRSRTCPPAQSPRRGGRRSGRRSGAEWRPPPWS